MFFFTFRGIIVIYWYTASHFWSEPDSGRYSLLPQLLDFCALRGWSPPEQQLDASRSNSGKKADLVSFSSSSPLSSPSLSNRSPGSFVFTVSTSYQLLAALSDQTIINSIVDHWPRGFAEPRQSSHLQCRALFADCLWYVWRGERRGEGREDRRVEESRGESRRGEERRGEVSSWMSIPDSIY